MTFSAPKSVSLLALIGRDERIVGAFRDSVTATLGWAEKNPPPPWSKPASGIRRPSMQVAREDRQHGRRHLPPRREPQQRTAGCMSMP
jgi:hypothetical protein